MQSPKRKPGKYTDTKDDPYITQEKYNKLKSSLKRLLEVERPPAIKDVKEQAAFGDFSENAAYSIAKGKLRSINNRITKIENFLKKAIIIQKSSSNEVQLGSIITIENDNEEKTYQILGSAEVNVTKGVISHNSPIGSALIGKKEGDNVEIALKDKSIKYKIIKIQ